MSGYNTPRLFPCKIIDMNNMLRKVNYPFPKEYFYLPIYVMTNEQETNGASILLYEGALKGSADTKESDMYIFPARNLQNYFLWYVILIEFVYLKKIFCLILYIIIAEKKISYCF